MDKVRYLHKSIICILCRRNNDSEELEIRRSQLDFRAAIWENRYVRVAMRRCDRHGVIGRFNL